MTLILSDGGLTVPLLIQILDLFGTMAFAVTGAFRAIEHGSDIVGIIILATITGVAGGILRDIVFGRIPPLAIANPLYLIITVTTAVILFFLYRILKNQRNLFLKFDAIGLGVFYGYWCDFCIQLGRAKLSCNGIFRSAYCYWWRNTSRCVCKRITNSVC